MPLISKGRIFLGICFWLDGWWRSWTMWRGQMVRRFAEIGRICQACRPWI